MVFGRARKRQIPGGGILPFAVDFIRLDRDMTVSLSIDNVAIPFDKFSHLLHDGKAVTIRQVNLLFNFDFLSCDLVYNRLNDQ